ncbi:C40 family peptidase [Pediococcus siamensis]|uniref:C40 family peptidase n=1 Tax=Pediococcus siamensis TaxID=381829 RepID=UPI0039A1693B
MKTKTALPILLFFTAFLTLFFTQSSVSANNLKPIQGIQSTENHKKGLAELSIPQKTHQIKATTTTATAQKTKTQSYANLNSLLHKQLGKAYVWGAVGPDTFDCSGLTQYSYAKAFNKKLPRTAQAQYQALDHVSHADVQAGDLVFFSYSGGATIDHVGIIVKGHNQMIDAQDRGVIQESYMASYWKPYIVGYAHVTDLD